MSETKARDAVALIEALADDELMESTRRVVTALQGQAGSYVWGRQDGGDRAARVIDPYDFSVAYGWHVFDYETGKRGSRHSIADAYRSYVAGVEIGEYA